MKVNKIDNYINKIDICNPIILQAIILCVGEYNYTYDS